MRRFKHWFRHEWVDDQNPYSGWKIRTHKCAYPGCEARSLYDRQDNVRFGVTP